MDGLRKIVAGLVAIAAGVLYATHSHAAAPIVGKGQAPGYYRMMLGHFEVIALNDDTLGLDVAKILTNTTPTRVEQPLKRSFLADPVETSVNAYLVNTGARLVLIDAGAGKLTTFDGAGELGPGIRAVPTYGHTKGHTAYMVESKGQKLAASGDLMHTGAVQFPNPAVTISFDTDPTQAAVQRRRMYEESAKQRFWIAAAHVPFPGIGHLRAEGGGYGFVPANYAIPR